MSNMDHMMEQQYHALKPNLERLREECGYTLREALKQAGIKTHSVLSRIKTLESTREKISRKDQAESLDEIEDLVGLRVVCLLRSDIPRIAELIRKEFNVIMEDNKIDGAQIDAFGYQSVHFIAKLDDSSTGPRYNGLHEKRFEIQVRTVAMDAWATLSHYLDYKNESDTPKRLRKDFFALSGLFYVADTHFELFYEERQKSIDAAKFEMREQADETNELNLDTFSAYLKRKYPERDEPKTSKVSDLLEELVKFGYDDFSKIESGLEKAKKAFEAYEESSSNNFSIVGVVRISFRILDERMTASWPNQSEKLRKYRPLIS